jgi:DNA-binding NtrC family response regulator
MSANKPEHILVVDDNSIFREALAGRLRASGHGVLVAETGEQAFSTMRDRRGLIGWLYTRVALPGLIDGWILADEYHDTHATRAVVLSAAEARSSQRGDIVLHHPSLATAFETIQNAINGNASRAALEGTRADGLRRAA